MPQRTTTFSSTSRYHGSFSNAPAEEVGVNLNGAIYIRQGTFVAGSKYVFGGIWVGQVQSDADVPTITVDVTFDIATADGIVWGIGYANASASIAAGAVDAASGDRLAASPYQLIQSSGFRPWPIYSRVGPLDLPWVFTRRFQIAKPPAASSLRRYWISIQFDSWTGGGGWLEAHVNINARITNVVVVS